MAHTTLSTRVQRMTATAAPMVGPVEPAALMEDRTGVR